MAEEATTGKRGIRREDPPPRPVEQTANRGFLEGADTTKHYVWVSEVNDPTINVGYYKHLGYRVSQYDPREARPTVGYLEGDYKQGDPIKQMGLVLMECSKERKDEIDQNGPDGKSGWVRVQKIVDTIKHKDMEPLSPEEQRQFRGIKSVRTEQDDRARWEF